MVADEPSKLAEVWTLTYVLLKSSTEDVGLWKTYRSLGRTTIAYSGSLPRPCRRRSYAPGHNDLLDKG